MYALTTKPEPMPYTTMLRSIGLLSITWLLQSTSGYIHFVLGFIDVKIVLEYLGSIAAFSTIAYNVTKTWELIHKYYISFKWKRKRKTDKSTTSLPSPLAESDVNDDQFD